MRPASRDFVLPLIGALVCALSAVAVASFVFLDPGAQRLDATALHGFNALGEGVLFEPTRTAAVLGGYLPIFVGLPLLYMAGRRWGRRREAIAGILVVLASGVTAEIVKVLSSHPRFQPILGTHQVNSASFPSGTVAVAMAVWVAALLVVPARLRLRTAAAGAVFVVAVASSVMIHTWHFPSDVLGAILVAVGYGFAAGAALRYLGRRPASRSIARQVPRRPSRAAVEAGAATFSLGVLALGIAFSAKLAHYAGTYTTTMVVGLAISAIAAVLLTAFGIAVRDER